MAAEDSGFVPFNPDEEDRRARLQYTVGTFQGLIDRVKPGRKKKEGALGDQSPEFFRLATDVRALRDPSNPKSGVPKTMTVWWNMPFEPADWKDRLSEDNYAIYMDELEKFKMLAVRNLAALFPDDVPSAPVKQGDVWYFKGEPLDVSYEKAVAECKKAAIQKCHDLWASKGKELVGLPVVFQTFRPKDGDGGVMASTTLYSEAPVRDGESAKVITGNAILSDGPEEGGSGGDGGDGGGKKKPAAKKRK